MNLFDIVNLKGCVCFVCLHKWTKSICFHWVLSVKNQWVLIHQSIRIRKHQRGAEISSSFPLPIVCPLILRPIILYRNLDFESHTLTLKTVSRMIFLLKLLSSACLLSSSTQLPIPKPVLWFPTTHPPLFFFHTILFLVCHSPPLLITSIVHGSTQTPLCHP